MTTSTDLRVDQLVDQALALNLVHPDEAFNVPGLSQWEITLSLRDLIAGPDFYARNQRIKFILHEAFRASGQRAHFSPGWRRTRKAAILLNFSCNGRCEPTNKLLIVQDNPTRPLVSYKALTDEDLAALQTPNVRRRQLTI